MKNFKEILELYRPRGEDEQNFVDMHTIEKKPHPVAGDDQFSPEMADAHRDADYVDGEDEYAYADEDEMDDENEDLEEEAQPKWRVSFKTKHQARVVSARNSAEAIKKAEASTASTAPGSPVYKSADRINEEMTPSKMKKREEYVKGMKKKSGDFKARYGKDAKSVMYATANKMAMKESRDLQEAVAHKWLNLLIDAIAKNADRPEFQKAAQEIEDWGNKYKRSYDQLRRMPGMIGLFFDDLFEALEIRVMYESAVIKESENTLKPGPMKLADGTRVNVSSSDAAAVSKLFGELNDKNKETMSKRMMKDKKGYTEILAFAKELV